MCPATRSALRELGPVYREIFGKHFPAMTLVGARDLFDADDGLPHRDRGRPRSWGESQNAIRSWRRGGPRAPKPSARRGSRRCAWGACTVAEHRTWVPAMVPWRATEDGFVTPEVLDWYGRFAQGRPGVLVVEATGIRDGPERPLLRIGDDRFIPGLRRLVELVRERSDGHTRLFIQAIDFVRSGAAPAPATFFARYLEIEHALRTRLADVSGDAAWITAPDGEVRAHARVRDAGRDRARARRPASRSPRLRVSRAHLGHSPAAHPRAAEVCLRSSPRRARARARPASMASSSTTPTRTRWRPSSPRLNTREDGYGGTREGRLRLPLEVPRAVRARVGD
jgi:hypothetical protein